MPEASDKDKKIDLKALGAITRKVLQHQPKKQERKDGLDESAKSSI